MKTQQTFKLFFLDNKGKELYSIYRNYIGTVTDLRGMVLLEIESGAHPDRVVDVNVEQVSGIS